MQPPIFQVSVYMSSISTDRKLATTCLRPLRLTIAGQHSIIPTMSLTFSKATVRANAVGVTLGNGRFYTMRQNYKPYKIPTFGYPKMRMNMIIEYTDGTKQRVNSDEKWSLTAEGPIRSNNEYDGEIYDARLDLGDWTKPGYDDSKWLKAQRAELPFGTLRGNTAPT